MTLVFIYTALTLLIALHLGSHMAFRLDRYDWRYGEVWLSFWLAVVLWPLLLCRPRAFLKLVLTPTFPSTVMDIDLAARERELDRLANTPPPCGAYVSYHHKPHGKPGSMLTFPAEAIEALLTDPKSGACDPDILSWVSRRDASEHVTTDVPAPWGRFEHIAAGLTERGCSVAQCKACGSRTPGSDLQKESADFLGRSWHFWRCACGNTLLQVEGISIHF